MKDFVKQFAAIEEVRAKLVAEFVENGEENLLAAAKETFNNVPGLKKFVVLGYTPSFNNGEPCEHSSYGGFGAYKWLTYSWGNSPRHIVTGDSVATGSCFNDFLEFDADDCSYPGPIEYANSAVEDEELAHNYINGMICLCDVVCGTNYEIKFWLDDEGVVHFSHDFYDCGY